MDQQICNEFITSLYGKIPDKDLKILKTEFLFFFNDYDIIQKETLPAVSNENLFKELNQFIASKAISGRSKKTLAQYYRTNSKLLLFCGKPVSDITTIDIQSFLYEYKKVRKISNTTLKTQLWYLESFFMWLLNNSYIDRNPCAALDEIKPDTKLKEPLTVMELERLRNVCKTPREKAIVEVFYSTGCRVSEVCNMKIADLSYERKEIIMIGKGNKQDKVPLSDRAILAIDEYLSTRKGESEYLFINSKKPYNKLSSNSMESYFRRLGERAGFKFRLHPHKMRRTTATIALNRGMSIEQVQKLLRHESISTTMLYAKVNVDDVKRNHVKYIT